MNSTELAALKAAVDGAESLDDVAAFVHELQPDRDEENERTFPFTIELDEPIQLGSKGTPITSITVRAPVMGDLAGVPINIAAVTFDELIKIAAKLCRLPPRLLEKLPADKGHVLTEVASSFLVSCL